MFKVKEDFFGRFNQSFLLFKENFIQLFIVLFSYKLIALIFFNLILGQFIASRIVLVDKADFFAMLLNPNVILVFFIGSIFFLLYILVYIIVYLSVLYTIKKTIKKEKTSINEIVIYGKNRFLQSFKTYWYIFEYTYLLPSILLIISLSYLLFGLEFNSDLLSSGFTLLAVVVIFGLYYILYRGIKAKFALFSAVDKDYFNKENFLESVKITKDKWWMILGNILLIGILFSIAKSVIKSIIGMLYFFGSGGGKTLMEAFNTIMNSSDPKALQQIIEDYFKQKSILLNFLNDFLSMTIDVIGTVFLFIFMYLLFLRLYNDFYYKNPKELIIENKNIDGEKIEVKELL